MAAAARLAGMALLVGAAAAATPPAEPPLADSRCRGADLVDADLRDAALQTLQQLVVRAPGLPSDGAVRTHPEAGHVDDQGHAWQLVSAYPANLGLMGALRMSPQWLPVAESWLKWQARHIATVGPQRGVVLDQWVRTDTLEQSSCPRGLDPQLCGTVDAYDSTAATTLLMADAYLRQGGNVAVLRDPLVRGALEAAAAALRDLTTAEGLTWALPQHPVAYTMDAAEVVAGWRAWARVQRHAYAEPASADNTLLLADHVLAAMDHRLWDRARSRWRVSADAATAPLRSNWYPDTMAQAWPLLWGHQAATRTRDARAWQRAIATWLRRRPHWTVQVPDPDGFLWPAAAVAAHCSGDSLSARRWVTQARRRWLHPSPSFGWPFQIDDLLWLFWLSEPPPRPPTFPPIA